VQGIGYGGNVRIGGAHEKPDFSQKAREMGHPDLYIGGDVGHPPALLLAFLLAVAAIGIGCAFNPEWGMRHFGRSLMGGGELRKDWNRMQMSAVGLIVAGVALYFIYALIFK
jgi:hypothetical protein